jgi:hypothetical protein
MALLVWNHGTTRTAARDAILEELRKHGHDGKVKWKGDKATVSVGWGAILHAEGTITDETVVLEKCGGAVSAIVLSKCREMLERAFPRGEPT